MSEPRSIEETEREPFLVEPGFERSVTLGRSGVRLLIYAEGTIRVEHRCDRGRRGVVIAAPALRLDTGEHRIVTADPVTVEPSVLCKDCGLHGFVREGRWVAA